MNSEFNNIINDYNGSVNSSNIGTLTSTLTLTVATNSVAQAITSSSTTTNSVTITSDSLTTGSALRVITNSADTSARNLVAIINDNSAATLAVNLFLDQDADAQVISIDNESTTENCFNIDCDPMTTGNVVFVTADNLSTGSILNLQSNSGDVSSRNLVAILNDNTAATGAACLLLDNDSTGSSRALTIDVEGTGAVSLSQAGDGNVVSINAEHATLSSIILEISATRAADAAYRFCSFESNGGSDVEFAVDGTGQIFADQAAITSPADYVCHDCGHSTLEKHSSCPECHSGNFHWNDDTKQFLEIAMGESRSLILAEKMGLIQRKGELSDRWNMNINRMIGFIGFGMNQLSRRIDALEKSI